MSSVPCSLEILLALHRRLYLLDESKENLSQDIRTELYRLVRKKFECLDAPEQKYLMKFVSTADISAAKETVKKAQDSNIKILDWFSPEYPKAEISSPPPILYISGEMTDPSKEVHVAIVGARRATRYGIEMTEKIVQGLKPYNVVIVSGLAYGIDITAHRAALANGLKTVAVLGCGIDNIYPVAHAKDKDAISRSGAVVSEFPWGTPPLPHNFPLRNRVISGLSVGIIVVEAMIKSGTLITAKWAADQGREVMAVPGTVGRAMSEGPNLLIRDGAHLIESGEDVAGILKLQRCENNNDFKNPSGHFDKDNAIKAAVVDYINDGQRDFDRLAAETGLAPAVLFPLITEVELIMKGF